MNEKQVGAATSLATKGSFVLPAAQLVWDCGFAMHCVITSRDLIGYVIIVGTPCMSLHS